MISCCLFGSTIRKVSNTNIALKYLSLEVTSKRFGKEEAQFNYFDRFYIQGFDNI